MPDGSNLSLLASNARDNAGGYDTFLSSKMQIGGDSGFDATWFPDLAFDFQRAKIAWACKRGRAANFSDCGLGKTVESLGWAENVVRHTNGRVLIVTPLAVSAQFVREGEKFGVDCRRSKDGRAAGKITVTNYEKLHHFDRTDYVGVVCDESAAIKNFAGERRKIVTEFMLKMPYRLLCTATAAPNDYIELGTTAEALGEMGRMDMLARFFKNDENSLHPIWWGARWRLKKHGELAFWRWVASWARAMRRPSDMGFSDDQFVLPPLHVKETVVHNNAAFHGQLFPVQAVTLQDQREERRLTLDARCEAVAEKVSHHAISLMWCHLNDEGDLLERLVPNALQVAGKDSDEWKETAIEWFQGEVCICNNPIFRAKLAAWQKDPMVTGSNIMLNTANSGLRHPINTAQRTKTSANPITPPTTKPILKNTSALRNRRNSAKLPDGPGMLQTLHTGQNVSGTLLKPELNGLKHAGNLTCESMASPSPAMTECLPGKGEAAPSAAQRMAGTLEQGVSTLTTATAQGLSEDCFAAIATLDLESLVTARTEWSAQQCICGHASGVRRLISKPAIFGFGLNLQHCAHMTFFPSHSYEQFYQAVRRCWRFGQKMPVYVDIITTEGELGVLKNLQRKSEQADAMFAVLVREMNNALGIARTERTTGAMEVPSWL